MEEVRDAYKQFAGVDMPSATLSMEHASSYHKIIQENMANVEDVLSTKKANRYVEEMAEEEGDENGSTDDTGDVCPKITDFFTQGASKSGSEDDKDEPDTDHAIDGVLLAALTKLIRLAGSPQQRTGVKIKLIELGRLLSKLEEFMDTFAFEEEVAGDNDDDDGDDDDEENEEELAMEAKDLREYTDSMIERIEKTRERDDSDEDAEFTAKKYKRLRREASFRID